MGKLTTKAVFKQYAPSQVLLLPPSLDELVPARHLARVVNAVVDSMDLSVILNSYKGGGTSSYHPGMLIKVLLYAYCMKIYTGRRIAKALREDVNFMWLAAFNRPDFRTINNFRSSVVKDHIEGLFSDMLLFLMEHEYIRFENYFCDGSTFEANANRHKMVWKKNAVRYREAAEQKCRELFAQIDQLNEAEDKSYGGRDLEETGSYSDGSIEDQIRVQSGRLDQIIATTATEKRRRRRAVSLRRKLMARRLAIAGYDRQQQVSADRSGYSVTDPDATAMKMKNGLILPAYNLLIGSEDQFIVNYSIHQKTNDGACFEEHYRQLGRHTDHKVQYIVADSIFGTEQNCELLETEGVGNYLKFPLYDKEQTRGYKSNTFNKDRFPYDTQADSYSCPQGRALKFSHIRKDTNRNGYVSEGRVYECEDCSACAVATLCKKTVDGNRTIVMNERLERYKQQMRDNLSTEKGRTLMSRRGHDVESCFGDLKMNQGFRRFQLRGKQKVNAEAGILAMAHNLRKMHIKKLQAA